MSNEAEILPNLLQDESFEIVMRGYNRRQVDDYIARAQQSTANSRRGSPAPRTTSSASAVRWPSSGRPASRPATT